MRELGRLLQFFGIFILMLHSVLHNEANAFVSSSFAIQSEGSSQSEFDAPAIAEEGRSHLADGNFDLALESFRQLLALAERSSDVDASFGSRYALQMMARIEEASGNFDGALEYRSQAREIFSDKTSKALYALTKTHCQLSKPKRVSLSNAYAALLRSHAIGNAKSMFDAAGLLESELGSEHLASRLALLETERLSQYHRLNVPAMEHRVSRLTEELGSNSIFVTDAIFVLGRRLVGFSSPANAKSGLEKLEHCVQVYRRHAWLGSGRLFDCHLAQADCYNNQFQVGEAKQALDLAKSAMASLKSSPKIKLRFLAKEIHYGINQRSPPIAFRTSKRGIRLLERNPELLATATDAAAELTGLSGYFFNYCKNYERSDELYSWSGKIINEHCPVKSERINESVRLLTHWSKLKLNSNDVKGAKDRIDRAISMLRKSQTEDQSYVLGYRGVVLQKMGRYSDSIDDLTGAIDMTKGFDPYWVQVRSRSHFLAGDVDKAIVDAKTSFQKLLDRFKNGFTFAEPISSIMLADEIRISRSIMNVIAVKTNSELAIREAVEMSLRSKSISFRAIKLFATERPSSSELDGLQRKLDEVSSSIARYAVDGQSKMTRKLEEERADIVHEIAEQLPDGFLDELDTEIGQIERLRRVLPHGVAVVEFETYPSSIELERNDRILAFIIRKEANAENAKLLIDIVDIGDLSELGTLIKHRELAMGERIASRTLLAVRGIKKEKEAGAGLDSLLSDKLWKGIEPLVKDHQKVIICPTGMLSKVGWGGLLIQDGKHKRFLTEKYQYAVNRSTHNVLRLLETEHTPKTGCLAVGGVDYGDATLEDDNAPLETFGRLQFTLDEAKSTLASFASAKQKTKLLQGKEASIKQLQEHISDFGVVHIASHGYLAKRDDVRGPMAGNGFYEKFPLLRSSLVLANANSDRASGLWTGAEVLKIDMSHVDLAILSTCNSAVGVVFHSEVVGLQTAFELAGARSTLSSHSSLSDAKAKRFVEAFVKNRVEKGLSKGAAFQQAQLKMIKEGVPVEFWQGWQLNGDWR